MSVAIIIGVLGACISSFLAGATWAFRRAARLLRGTAIDITPAVARIRRSR